MILGQVDFNFEVIKVLNKLTKKPATYRNALPGDMRSVHVHYSLLDVSSSRELRHK